MAKRDRKAKRKEARQLVKERIRAGKKVNASKIAKKTGVSEKRAQKIADRKTAAPSTPPAVNPKKYFEQNDPGEKISKKELRQAQDAGVNITKLNRYVNNEKNDVTVGNKAGSFLQKQVSKVSTKLEDYDPRAAGGAGFGKRDIKHLMSEEGGSHSLEAIMNHMDKYDSDSAVKVGNKAQAFLETKMKQQKDASPAPAPSSSSSSSSEDTRIAAPSQGGLGSTIPKPSIGVGTQAPPKKETKVDQSGTNNFSNTGTFIGNNNQGADYSVTVDGSASDNMKNAVKYMELNNNAQAKSQARMSGSGRAAQAVEVANTMTDSKQRIANDDYMTRIQPLYMGAKGTQSQTKLFGDTFNFETPKFEMPTPGKKPKDKTKEIAEMYKS